MQKAFPLDKVVERPMRRGIVVTGAAVLVGVLAKRGRRNRSGDMHSNRCMDRAPFKQFELAANNLKTATKKVDNSAAAVEVALKVLRA
jgi:hypothetical protein